MEPLNSNNNHESSSTVSPPPSPPPPQPQSPRHRTSTSESITPAEQPHPPHYYQPMTAPPQPPYYYQPAMVMPPPVHYQVPAPWGMQPPPNYNAGHSQLHGYIYPGYPRSWSTGLCSCSSDIKNCVVTAFCPCITFGQIYEIINEGQTSCWEGCLLYGIVNLLCGPETGGIITGVLGGWYRNKLRQKYKLRGTMLSDCLVHALCQPCALCQEYRELGRNGFEVPLGWKKNMEMQKAAVAVYEVAPVFEQGMGR